MRLYHIENWNSLSERNNCMNSEKYHKIYNELKSMNQADLPTMLLQLPTKEEQTFYVTVADFFLQQRQKELIAKNIY